MEAHLCNHPMVPHTVEYQIGGATATVSRPFDHLEDADIFAQKIIRQNPGRLTWLKIYRSDNPVYCCFVWENSKKENNMADSQKVKLEVDMEPLGSAFENIAQGFKEQGASIRALWAVQGFLGLLLTCDLVIHLIS